MADDNTILLIAGGVGLYLFASGRLGNPASNRAASGRPPPKAGPGLGAGACIAAGAATGNAAAGVALAPLCDQLPRLLVDGGVKVATKAADGVNWASNHAVPVVRSLFGLGSGGTVMTAEQATKWKADVVAKGGTPPTGCGGWKGTCPTVQTTEAPVPPAPAPRAFTGSVFKPAGFR